MITEMTNLEIARLTKIHWKYQQYLKLARLMALASYVSARVCIRVHAGSTQA